MKKSTKINILATIILVGFTFGILYHYVLGFYMNKGSLYNSFLYPSNWAFCDFFDILPYIKHFKPYQEGTLWIVYFPLTYIIMLPFAFIKNKIIAYLLYLSGFVIYLTYMNRKNFSCKNLNKLQNFQNIIVITFFSYPFLYCIDKGNVDIYLFVLLGFWAYAFKREKYWLSSFLLALINAMKPFTLYFLLLYLMKKKYKEAFLSILLAGLFVLGGFLFFHDGLIHQMNILIGNVNLYKKAYTSGSNIFLAFCSSVFIPLKIILLNFSQTFFSSKTFVLIYDYLSYAVTIITLFFVWQEKVFWKQLTLLICNFLLLPYVTYDYKLIFLFIPLWFFVNTEKTSKFDLVYIILFALLFIPKNIMISFPEGSRTSFSAIVNPVIMILLTVLIIYEQFRNKKLEGKSV
jgi:hypothetical protein